MLRLTRRTLLKLSIVAGLLLGRARMALTEPLRNLVKEKKPLTQNQTLDAFLETLIPADTTPSALQAGVKEKIIAKAETMPRLEGLIQYGCLWLDKKAIERGSTGFPTLSEGDRETVVAIAASAGRKSKARSFFATMRHLAFSYYYSEPAIWKDLHYPGPPQPKGFKNYYLQPKRKPA